MAKTPAERLEKLKGKSTSASTSNTIGLQAREAAQEGMPTTEEAYRKSAPMAEQAAAGLRTAAGEAAQIGLGALPGVTSGSKTVKNIAGQTAEAIAGAAVNTWDKMVAARDARVQAAQNLALQQSLGQQNIVTQRADMAAKAIGGAMGTALAPVSPDATTAVNLLLKGVAGTPI